MPYHSTALPFVRVHECVLTCLCRCQIVYAGGFGKVKGHLMFVEAVFVCLHWQMDCVYVGAVGTAGGRL